MLRPAVIDTGAEVRDDFPLTYLNLSSDVATVDSDGRVSGVAAGFSTLTVAAGGAISSFTITVVRVTSGLQGFTATGVTQDLSQRLYLAHTSEHTVLRTESLGSMPEIYAGVEASSGLRDEVRLDALFHEPSFLTFDQGLGVLYVIDAGNHAVRQVNPGTAGRVETVAGTASPGSADGNGAEASFRSPQGVVLDPKGRLWVADTGNHTIRLIDRMKDSVTTVAGQAGAAGRGKRGDDRVRPRRAKFADLHRQIRIPDRSGRGFEREHSCDRARPGRRPDPFAATASWCPRSRGALCRTRGESPPLRAAPSSSPIRTTPPAGSSSGSRPSAPSNRKR